MIASDINGREKNRCYHYINIYANKPFIRSTGRFCDDMGDDGDK